MTLEYVRLLEAMREVYAMPRGPKRFLAYIRLATGGRDDIGLPVSSFNPMAREHVVARLEELLQAGVEEAGKHAAREIEEQLQAISGHWKTGFELVDDVRGGWSNRWLTDATARFPSPDLLARPNQRPFATALLWASEEADTGIASCRLRAAVYRATYRRKYGAANTLAQMVRQEGLAALYAGEQHVVDRGAVAALRQRWGPLVHSARYPESFALLYGDEAASSVGYAPLGVSAMVGFAAALEEVREAGLDPVEMLIDG